MSLQELLDLDLDTDKFIKNQEVIYNQIANSLVANWNWNWNLNRNTLITNYLLNTYNTNDKQIKLSKLVDNLEQESSNIKYNKYNKYNKYIQQSFISSNSLEKIVHPELTISQLEQFYYLNCKGVDFVFKSSPDIKIEIKQNDVLFPICCVGKNRSQYLFYYLKYLQSINHTNNLNGFLVGYPSSGDEFSTILEQNSLNQSSGSVLSGFTVQHKPDGFSSAIKKSFGTELSRTIHVLDKILKNPEDFGSNELTNSEDHKYKSHRFDIFKKDNIDIKLLYLKYFFNPENINLMLNHANQQIPYQKYRITYICASPQSFIRLVELFFILTQSDQNYNLGNLSNLRIVYLGFNDIFQRSSIKENEVENLKNNLDNTFVII